MTEGVPPSGRPWAVGRSLVWSFTAGAVLLVLGALLGRADAALLGAAPLVASVWALTGRPRGVVWASVDRVDDDAPGGGPGPGEGAAGGPGEARAPGTALHGRVHLAAPPGTEAVRLRVARQGHGPTEALVHVPLRRDLSAVAASVRTGPQELFRLEHQGLGPAGDVTGPFAVEEVDRVLVLPATRPVPALPLPLRLRGTTGPHGSRRPGDGGDLRDVHPYGPEDTLRRVDWRATARRSPDLAQLYVRRTFGMGEALVTLVVDSRDDVGPDPATWSGSRPVRPDDATSLDLARQAAASLAGAYLAAGDRVAVEDLGVRRRAVRPGTGRRHLARVVHQLALLRPEGDPPRRIRPPQLPSGALVVLVSTFLDPQSAELAQVLRRNGHRVVAVDVLPRLRTEGLDGYERIALRMLRIERDDRLAEVVAAGAELVRWADVEGTTARLQTMARRVHRRPGAGVGR